MVGLSYNSPGSPPFPTNLWPEPNAIKALASTLGSGEILSTWCCTQPSAWPWLDGLIHGWKVPMAILLLEISCLTDGTLNGHGLL